jgi:SRSO17 transposase
VLARLARKLDEELPGIEAFVIDDTGFPKKGEHSVGVQRQYSGTLGRIDNCQVAVSLHVAGEQGSGMVGFQLFLPESWVNDRARRKRAGIPTTVQEQRKARWRWRNLMQRSPPGFAATSCSQMPAMETPTNFVRRLSSADCGMSWR